MIYVNLRELLHDRGITANKLAQLTRLRGNTISDLCNNNLKRLPLDALSKICYVLHCQPGDLLELVPEGQINNIETWIQHGVPPTASPKELAIYKAVLQNYDFGK